MKILLIDDHPSFCEGLTTALASYQADYDIDAVSTSEELLEVLSPHHDYDLLITDLLMPGINGFELIRELIRRGDETPIMVMSSVSDQDMIRSLLRMGVMGYLPKSYSVSQIYTAIEECRSGIVHVPASLEGGLERQGSDRAVDRVDLTRRQLEILKLMDRGGSNQEIADELHLSTATVKTHINNLFSHFEVNNRVSCLRAARIGGWL